MQRMLTPVALRYIDQVARSGSIQRAARELHVAASAVNRQILQLEAELGAPLFERIPRGMRLTPSGEALVMLARRWREDERRTAIEIRRLQGIDQGVVRLMAMDSHSTGFLPPLVAQVTERHPRIALSIEIGSTDDAASALVAGRIDLAAVFNLAPMREVLTLWSVALPFGCVVARSHPLAALRSASIQEICRHPVALQSRALVIRRYIEANYSWLFSDMRGQVETDSLNLIKALVLRGSHVAITSELDAAAELLDGSLVFVPVRDQGAEPQTISVVADARIALTPIVRAVADLAIAGIVDSLQAIRDQSRSSG